MVLRHFVLGMNFLMHDAARSVMFMFIFPFMVSRAMHYMNSFPCAASVIHYNLGEHQTAGLGSVLLTSTYLLQQLLDPSNF